MMAFYVVYNVPGKSMMASEREENVDQGSKMKIRDCRKQNDCVKITALNIVQHSNSVN